MSVNSKMTSIADEVRTLSGTTDMMGLDAIASNVKEANNEVDTQSGLIAQILTALEGKAASGSTDSGGTFVTGDFTYTTEMSEPGTYDFTLTSEALQSSSRQLVIVFVMGSDNYSETWKVFYRADLNSDFTMYLGSKSYVYNGLSSTVNENTINVVATSIADDTFTKFWFLAM